jgi:hypothetical protein
MRTALRQRGFSAKQRGDCQDDAAIILRRPARNTKGAALMIEHGCGVVVEESFVLKQVAENSSGQLWSLASRTSWFGAFTLTAGIQLISY